MFKKRCPSCPRCPKVSTISFSSSIHSILAYHFQAAGIIFNQEKDWLYLSLKKISSRAPKEPVSPKACDNTASGYSLLSVYYFRNGY